MPTFEILDYNVNSDNYKLKNLDTRQNITADLFFNLSFRDSNVTAPLGSDLRETQCRALIGQKVDIKELVPYEYIAIGVELIEPVLVTLHDDTLKVKVVEEI